MSSLLDVLHKRPSRSRLAAAEALATQPESVADADFTAAQTAELRLAPDADLSVGTQGTRQPDPPVEESALEMAAPGGETTQMRRWADAVTPPRAEPARPRTATAPVRQLLPSRPMLLLVLFAATAVFAAWLVYEFTGQEEENFLAASDGSLPAPPPPVADAVPSTGTVATVTATTPVKKKSRPGPAVAEPIDEPVDDGGDVAWYDQPALPGAVATAAAVAPVIQITRGSSQDPLFDKLREAYAALQVGAAPQAESLYREVLALQPASVDALLGLGTLANRAGRLEEARDLYRQVQRLDPKNGTAAAALSALSGAGAQVTGESQLKSMLREQPASGALHFALGLRYVADQRWPDAQQAFFEAVRSEPTNADFAFNLAVSLDRLGQVQPAASYYQRAIDLAAGSQQFDVTTARARLQALRGPQG